MKNILFIFFGVMMISCSEKNKKKAHAVLNNYKDTIINPSGVIISKDSFENMFFNCNYKGILSNKIKIDNQESIGLYIIALLDANEYQKAGAVAKIYSAEDWYTTGNGVKVPIFSSNMDDYLCFSLLRYNMFCQGFDYRDIIEMIVQNFYKRGKLDRNKTLHDYWQIDYLFNELMKDRSDTSAKLSHDFHFLVDKHKKNQHVRNLMTLYQDISKGLKQVNFEKLLNNDSVYQIAYYQKIYLDALLDNPIKDTQLIHKLCESYMHRFSNLCPVNQLRFLYSIGEIDTNYYKICLTCNERCKNVDSLKNKVYTAIYFMQTEKYDSLKNYISNYRRNNISKPIFTDIKSAEKDIYEILELRYLLKENLFRKYLTAIKAINKNYILHFSGYQAKSEDYVKAVTLFLLRQNKMDSSESVQIFEKRIKCLL
jgi:hypothetical protein